MMKLILVRHGETLANKNELNEKHTLNVLSPLGLEQIKMVAEELKNEHIDKIFVSTFERTKETAKPMIKTHKNATVEYREELIERNYGDIEGTPYGNLAHIYEKLSLVGEDRLKYKPKNGESLLEVRERIMVFITKLKKENSNKTVLIVSHGAILRQLVFGLSAAPYSDYPKYKMDNASITIIDWNEKPKIIKLNDTTHLK